MNSLTILLEVFVPIFVAMSPLSVLPVFISMTGDVSPAARRALANRAIATALIIAVTIVLLGDFVFRLLGITLDDLRIAGGAILFLIAVYDLIFGREQRKTAEIGSDVGAVPLGTPLIVGPATMTACVVLADTHGMLVVLIALSLNLTLMAVLLRFADPIALLAGPSVSRAFGKVMSLFLAAIAVAMLRNGLSAFLS